MKIAILTLTLHTNYGGILQAYALQTVLERMGHEVEVLNRPFNPYKTKWSEIPKRVVKKLLGRDVVIFRESRYNQEAPILNKDVWDFREKYIHERMINNLHEIKENDYECIVVGSDQVWRPKYFKSQWQTGIEDAYLAFTKGWNIKRIAYATSFGVDTWEYTDEETRKCKEAINLFDVISVREDSGVNLVKKYLNTDAIHILDPTFLLGKRDYTRLFQNKGLSPHKGEILVYILDADKNKSEFVNRIAKKKGLKTFTVNKTLAKQTSHLDNRVLPSIEEWLHGFNDADLVLTDSFHACVFSLIFKKPFIVIDNENRGVSRINSFLRFWDSDITCESYGKITLKKINYNCVYAESKIQERIEQSYKLLSLI